MAGWCAEAVRDFEMDVGLGWLRGCWPVHIFIVKEAYARAVCRLTSSPPALRKPQKHLSPQHAH
jgi:hypothetical protein